MIFSDTRFSNSCISAKYCPIITNHTSMEILFILLSGDVEISISRERQIFNPFGFDSVVKMIFDNDNFSV